MSDKELADRYNPFSQEVRDDPNPSLAALRQHCPVHRFTDFEYPLYTVTRHADVTAMLNDWKTFSSRHGQTHQFAAPEEGIRADPPQHTIFRVLLNPMFERRRVGAMEVRFHDIAHRIIDDFIDQGAGDISKLYFQPYPISVVSELLGVEPEREADFRRWASDYLLATATENHPLEADSRGAIYGYFTPIIDARRKALDANDPNIPDDVMTLLASSRHPEGRLFTHDELLPTTLLLLLGGTDTTTLLLGNCLRRLLEQPALWDQLKADPDLAEAAIEESLRFDSPTVGVFRTNNHEIEIAGVTIPANSKVQASFASANRDEAAWEDAGSFRLDRDVEVVKRRHLAFGRGIHTCIAANFARLDARVALEVLVERLPGLRLDGPMSFMEPYMMQGITGLGVRWD